ncbi:uncharacterized protein LOC143318817 [Chaetodon auriga]|uniref:uncharacterized protein LOC143318817 n=1 Tax=Chaetodon auriga TaxID=39042 RepID=UPI004032EA34
MEPKDRHRTFRTLTVVSLLVRLMFAAAAAESQSELTCEVKRLSDGSFLYKLSEPLRSTNCETCWETETKDVIARSPPQKMTDPVLNVTSQCITLKRCVDHLDYIEDCIPKDVREAHCRVNCSLLMNSTDQPTNVNSTQTCLFGSWCPDPLTFWISSSILIAAGAVCLGLWRTGRCNRRESAAKIISYTPANGQRDDDVEQGHVIQHNGI